jgi:hypothetical protein
MVYVINMQVVSTSNSDWRNSKPSGDNWHVVENKDGQAQDFNQKAGGNFIFIFYESGVSGNGVAAVRFISGKDATVPAGWTKIDVDLNDEAGGEYIYLCTLKNGESNYIEKFQSGYGDSAENALSDFNQDAVVLRQDLKQGAKGKYIFLGYYFNG